ncbi:MAG: protein-glutamate O-methyltransferase CheR, partial [Caulobacteraceae bacterium]
MSPEDIGFVVRLCRARAGLKVSAEKIYVIESRLTPIAKSEGFASAEALILAARESREATLPWRIVEAMASSETSFFRDRSVFEDLRARLIPELSKARAGGPVKVWSA